MHDLGLIGSSRKYDPSRAVKISTLKEPQKFSFYVDPTYKDPGKELEDDASGIWYWTGEYMDYSEMAKTPSGTPQWLYYIVIRETDGKVAYCPPESYIYLTMTYDTMTYDEFKNQIEKIIPGAQLEKDNFGQIIIYTGLECNSNDEVIPFEPDDPSHLCTLLRSRLCALLRIK